MIKYKRMIRVATAIVLAIAILGVPAQAVTLYVDGVTGDDSVAYAENTAERPWRTIGRAAWGSTSRDAPVPAQAAQPGDTVVVGQGTYSTPGTDNRFGVAYHTANSGRPNAPIVFQADGEVILTLSESRGPVIGASGFESGSRDYITWRGFTVHESTAPSRRDTGVAVLVGTIGSSIEDCVLDGNGDPGFGDNHPGVRIEGSQNVAVRNCLISNFRTSGVNHHNGAGIQVYSSGDVLLEHNEIRDSGSGIFLKAPGIGPNPPLGFTIRKNHIANMSGSGIAIHRAPNTSDEPILIYQNVVRDASMCVRIWTFDGGSTDPRHAKIVNNVLAQCGEGISVSGNLVQSAGHLVQNNIIAANDSAINFGGTVDNLTRPRIQFDHNVYFEFSQLARVYTSNYSIASWKNTFLQDSTEPGSRVADPLFVNAPQGDFRLQIASPASIGGIDILDLNGNGSTTDLVPVGAYISGDEIIGRQSGLQSSQPLAPVDVNVD